MRLLSFAPALLLLVMGAPQRALAQDAEPPTAPEGGAAPPSTAPEEDDRLDPEKGIPRPPPRDQRTWHPVLTGRVGWIAPAGSFAVDVPIGRALDTGPTYGGSLGLGLSRYVLLEASAEYAMPSPSSRCQHCSGRLFDAGLGLTYHLAQAVAVDPWISYGVGYRWARVVSDRAVIGKPGTDVYHGVDVARIGLGADFYPLPQIGFGPLLLGDFGTFVRRPKGLDPSVYAFFQIGVRLALDPFRRSVAPPAARTAAAR